jgi:DnaK suppressor protein
LRRYPPAIKLGTVQEHDLESLLAVVDAERERTADRIASLESLVASIVEGSELVSTDDEHDPEGATIAYERAQASALLRQARADLDALAARHRELEREERVVCVSCGREINPERLAALPTTSHCVACAS